MTPGERITLIKKIAAAIAEMDVGESSLMLRQFGLTPEFYVNEYDVMDTFAGAIASIQDAGDEVLLDLHAHVFGEAAPSPGHGEDVTAEGVWQPDMFRLFISHVSAHKAEVGTLKQALAWKGVDAFVAHQDIEPTKEWQDVIESALATCEALVAWLTPDFHASSWTDQEVGFCVARSVLAIPVRLGADPYGFIGKYQGLAGGEKTIAMIADEIVEILTTNDLTAARMAPRVVKAFTESGSFKSARMAFDGLSKIPSAAWTPELLDAVEQAAKENDQIVNAFYGTEMLRDAVARFVAERRGAFVSP